MPAKSDKLTFQTASAVLVAEPHNPAIINPDFLKNREIVPAELALAPGTICTPAFAQITYHNGLSVWVDHDRCIFAEMLGATRRDFYLAHQCAEEYAKKLEYNYNALGLNWQVVLAPPNPADWLKNRFFRPGKWRNDMKLSSFAFSIPAPGATTCNFTLQTAPQTAQANFTSITATLMLECNCHFDLRGVSEKTARISDILARGKEYESFLSQSIDKYLVKSLS